MGQSRRLTTVVAADICGYSRLAEIDDEAAIRTVHIVRAAFESVVAKRRGRLFHSSGDGFLAEFPSAADGVLAALDFVADIRARDSLSPTSPGAKVRAGVHSGDVMEQPGGDLLGHGVNIAARLQGEAAPNGVLVSQATRNLVRSNVEAEFHRRGALTLKNIDEPVLTFIAEAAVARKQSVVTLLRRVMAQKRKLAPVAAVGIVAATAYLVLQQWSPGARAMPQDEARVAHLADVVSPNARPSYLDDMYLRRVLGDLANTKTPDQEIVLALIDKNDIDAAIGALEATLASPRLSDRRRVVLLHQIGALSYERRPDKAIAVYEEALRENPDDFAAAVRLGRAHALQDSLATAKEYYQRAITIGSPDERALLELQTHRASLLMHEYDATGAIEILNDVVVRATALDLPPLIARAQTSLGQAYFIEGKFREARAVLVAAMALQKSLGEIDPEFARAENLMGQIDAQEGNYSGASKRYERQYAIEQRLQRAQGLTDALYFLGDAYLKLDRIDLAEVRFAEGLRIATENRISDTVFLHNVGLARVAKTRGNQVGACTHIKRAEAAFNRQSTIGPATRAVLTDLGCHFEPLGI
ncbi:MAG: tetratricopeptide repeat protein [Parvularculaceae bacterium]